MRSRQPSPPVWTLINTHTLLPRPHQREIILAALDGKDVFVQAATSFGKSLCFQLPAVIDRGSRSYLAPCCGKGFSLTTSSHHRHLTTAESHGTPAPTFPNTHTKPLTKLR